VDNVYSHRSTQNYKAKPFTSHYYDCRLKGRPSGTPKSSDPTKKKRKRVARERDLCDVKIKITEYQPGATREEINQHQAQQPRGEGVSADSLLSTVQGTVGWGSGAALKRFYTLQRVNGTGATAKEGECAGHRHTLADSDAIKKNSVIRSLTMVEKEKKKPVAKVKEPVRTIFQFGAVAAITHTLVEIWGRGLRSANGCRHLSRTFVQHFLVMTTPDSVHVSVTSCKTISLCSPSPQTISDSRVQTSKQSPISETSTHQHNATVQNGLH
jgi:hypothetical protein